MKNTHVLKDELENLRERLNKEVVKNLNVTNKEEYKNRLSISKELDDAIVSYFKSSNK